MRRPVAWTCGEQGVWVTGGAFTRSCVGRRYRTLVVMRAAGLAVGETGGEARDVSRWAGGLGESSVGWRLETQKPLAVSCTDRKLGCCFRATR